MAQIFADDVNGNQSKDPETCALIGAAMAVHSQLGCGFLEAVYQEAFALELEAAGIAFSREAPLAIRYRGRELSCKYFADFLCFGSILVELKAVESLHKSHVAQVINYLNAAELRKGLLLNFGSERLTFKRIVNDKHLRKSVSSAGKSSQ